MVQDVITFYSDEGYRESLKAACEAFRRGGLVVFPTETVYGVGARADIPAAVARLRRVKQRADEQPFTVHIGRRDDVDRFVPKVSAMARRLIRRGWPGPITILFPVDAIADAPIVKELGRGVARALYHEGLVGLRCPDDDRARDLLNEAGGPVVAASANVGGQPAPRNVAEALRTLEGKVDVVLDGGPTRLSVPSTIVQFNGTGYRVLRPGVYDETSLRRLTALNILLVCTGNTCRSPMAAAMCGQLLAERVGGQADALAALGVTVRSCGVFAAGGASASAEAVEVMQRRGLDLSGHRSQLLSAELVNQADHIFVMTQSHWDSVVRTVPSAKDRCRLLCDGEVDDPMGGSTERYAQCAAQLEAGLRERLKEVEI